MNFFGLSYRDSLYDILKKKLTQKKKDLKMS